MKFKYTVRQVGTKNTWVEHDDLKTVTSKYSAKQAAHAIIAKFNKTLRWHEAPREVLSVELIHEEISV